MKCYRCNSQIDNSDGPSVLCNECFTEQQVKTFKRERAAAKQIGNRLLIESIPVCNDVPKSVFYYTTGGGRRVVRKGTEMT